MQFFLRITLLAVMLNFILQSCANDDAADTVGEEDDVELTNSTAQLITEWNDLWISIDQFTIGMRPNSVTRALAYIHLAGYETGVPFMENYTSNNSRFDQFTLNEAQLEENVNLDLALSTAYSRAINHFMIDLTSDASSVLTNFASQKEAELSDGLSDSEIENSIEWGQYVAQQVIAFSQTDQEGEAQILNQTPVDYVAPVGAGLWRADEGESAWFPYWREVRTFVITPEETTTTDFSSLLTYDTDAESDYFTTMYDVYEITNAALNGNDEDLWIAEFWSDDVEGLMMSPPGRQFSIANQLIQQNDLEFDKTLELLLRLGFAINDAAVSAWDDKYTYNTQRPSTYLRENVDPDFTTNLSRFIEGINPAFPSYPSGHATFAAAAGGVFIDFFDTDSINFTDRTYEGFDYVVQFNGTPRSYTSFSEMALENAYSRVPLGVHILEDSTEGLRLGYEIAEAVSNFDLSN